MSGKKAEKNSSWGGLRIVCALLCISVFCSTLMISKSSYAHSCRFFGTRCGLMDCDDARAGILAHHAFGRLLITDHIDNDFARYRFWLREIFFVQNLLKALMMMTEQLSAVGMYQMQAVGALMDANIQMETQRAFQELQVRAIKDYQPSQDFCVFGSTMRSLSASESVGTHNKMALRAIQMDRLTGKANMASAGASDPRARWERFVSANCQVFNNNWDQNNPTISGLQPACATSKDSTRANADVQYERFINSPRTIDINFLDDPAAAPPTTDGREASANEEDVIALARNIYGHQAPDTSNPFMSREGPQEQFFNLRKLAAKRGVAQNSFNAIVGLKSSGSAATAPANTFQYMAAIMRNLGIDDFAEIQDLMGENPSYLAQLEVLAKRIYQDQSFYANLYDKPENVQRTSVAMRAIGLMVDREMFESRIRKEMLISVLLSSKLQKEYERVESNLEKLDEANR